jgi:hypothetical protein
MTIKRHKQCGEDTTQTADHLCGVKTLPGGRCGAIVVCANLNHAALDQRTERSEEDGEGSELKHQRGVGRHDVGLGQLVNRKGETGIRSVRETEQPDSRESARQVASERVHVEHQ